MVEAEQRICASKDLAEQGRGVRFRVTQASQSLPAFVVRYAGGKVSAFINQCAHRALELDWSPGEFFDNDGQFIICATHGALYEPSNGACVSGPCSGSGLTILKVREHRGNIYLIDDRFHLLHERGTS